MLCLNRLQITGPLNAQTPRCVICEIAECHGVDYGPEDEDDEIVRRIQTKRVPFLPDPSEHLADGPPRHAELIAQYINPTRVWMWNNEKLVAALNFLQSFVALPKLPSGPVFSVGRPTPVNVESYDACLLYKLCRYHGFSTDRETSIERMAQIVRLLTLSAGEVRELLALRSNYYDRAHLVSLLSRDPTFEELSILPSSRDTQRPPVQYQDLIEAAEQLRTIDGLRHRLVPKTAPEAVALAALNYRLDLSEARDPVAEYSLLSSVPRALVETYVPRDVRLRHIADSRPHGLSIDWYFNPAFPISFYTEEQLRIMVQNEGWTSLESLDMTPYELLQMTYLRNTFYPGKWPQVSNAETPILNETVAELEPAIVVCHGMRSGAMVAFTYGELADAFLFHRNFRNPSTRDESFDEVAVRKLKYLASLPSSGRAHLEREKLARAILETELFVDRANAKALVLFQAHQSADETGKEKICRALRALLELGMLCRGWSGAPQPYPIREAPVDNQHEVDRRVTESLVRWDEALEALGSAKEMVSGLPLIGYRGAYYASNDAARGLTVEQRISLLREGENTHNVETCMRLSSNWLCISAHRYMVVLGLPPPFDIDQFRHIS